ncbi:MAG: phosphoribosyltransferase family protein [bacterium]
MRSFKYKYHYAISNYISQKVIAQFGKYFTRDMVLVPVPSHPSKERERGFNQSLILAKKYSKLTGLPVINPLVRIKDSSQHAGMKRQERITDENPFKLKPEFVPQLSDKKLMIVDDVCTTGTTLIQCASELRKAGPRSASAIALFRGKK